MARKPTKISANGVALIKSFEGLKLDAYQDIVGVWTIGYGHTASAKSGKTITQAEADALLARDLELFEATIRQRVKVDLNQNEFDALVSLAFNIGVGAFQRSTLLRMLNNSVPRGEVAIQFLRWVKAGGNTVAGLVRRRRAEADLFLK